MPEPCSSNVWLWRDPDRRWLNKVLDYIKSSAPSDKDVVILHCEGTEDFYESTPLIYYLFNLSMIFQLLENERIMFLNLKDVISSMELFLSRQKKDNINLEIDIPDEEIINFYEGYLTCFQSEHEKYDIPVKSFKELLQQNNCVDAWQLQSKLLSFSKNSDMINHVAEHKYLILGSPSSPLIKKFIGVLAGAEIFIVTTETPLDVSLHTSPSIQTSSKIVVNHESMILKEVPVNSEHGLKAGSATEEYVEDIILAFLSLLVNSRNELALSKVMISPVIDLSHEAFTALKHLSVEKDMPMCQVAISYVTRVKLGGKGYAPPKDCPMLPHLKGFEVFVNTLNQMQTIAEEDPTPNSVVKRLITILKKRLLKCGSDRLKDSSIETVAKNLQSKILTISKLVKPTSCSSTESLLCQETLDFLYHFINFINCEQFICDPEVILSRKHAKRTPLNLPPLLGYFRSPEDESTCDTKSSFNEESNISRTSEIQLPAFPSYFHHESSEVSASCVNSSTPSKLTFKGCINENEENAKNERKVKLSIISSENSRDSVTKKNRKRSILGEITNENDSGKTDSNDRKVTKKLCKLADNSAKENVTKSVNKNKPKKEPKKVAKKFKQIEGQGKITSFFIMGKK